MRECMKKRLGQYSSVGNHDSDIGHVRLEFINGFRRSEPRRLDDRNSVFERKLFDWRKRDLISPPRRPVRLRVGRDNLVPVLYDSS